MKRKGAFLRDHKWTKIALMALLLGIVAFMSVYPLGMMLYGSFRSSAPGEPGNFTLDGYREALSDPGILMSLWNSLAIAAVRTFISISTPSGPIREIISSIISRSFLSVF